MTIAVCIDDQGGMMFNRRRLSRDRVQLADLAALGRPLWIAPYSAPLFPEEVSVAVDEDFLDKAGPGEVCFVEDRAVRPWLDRAERLLVYRWNRAYPSDFRLDIAPEAEGFVLEERTEFPGFSHERITREIFVRREGHG